MRAAVAGAGLMGRWHAAELARIGGELVAVIDSDPSAASALAARHPPARPYGGLAEALAASPQVLHVCTPVGSHAELVREGVEAGLHVLVEKPFAPDPGTTEELLELARSAGVLACPVHQYLFQPGTLAALEGRGRIEPLVHVEFMACSAGGRGGPSSQLDHTAAEILPHPLAVLERLLPGGADGVGWQASRPRSGELRAGGAAGGVTVAIAVSMNGRPTRNELRAIGERGTLQLDFFHGYGLREGARTSRAQKALMPFTSSGRRAGVAAANLARRALAAEPAYPGLRELIRRFYAACRAGGAPPVSPEECMVVARASERILGATATGRA